jgi:hypothetical protein
MGLKSWWRRRLVPSGTAPRPHLDGRPATAPGLRVAVGDPCPCGNGTVRRTNSTRYGKFLGCTDFPRCRRAWHQNGERLRMNEWRNMRGRDDA